MLRSRYKPHVAHRTPIHMLTLQSSRNLWQPVHNMLHHCLAPQLHHLARNSISPTHCQAETRSAERAPCCGYSVPAYLATQCHHCPQAVQAALRALCHSATCVARKVLTGAQVHAHVHLHLPPPSFARLNGLCCLCCITQDSGVHGLLTSTIGPASNIEHITRTLLCQCGRGAGRAMAGCCCCCNMHGGPPGITRL